MKNMRTKYGVEERFVWPALFVAACLGGIAIFLAPTLIDLLF